MEECTQLLTSILNALQSDTYEPGGYFTVGGAAGIYVIKSPWNTECEFQIVQVCTTQTTSIGFSISASNSSIVAPIKNTVAFGALSNGSEGNAFEGIAGFVIAGSPIQYPVWQPLGRNVLLYFNAGVTAGDSMLCTVSFRRSTLKIIPEEVPYKPATHSHVVSRRLMRTLSNESTLAAGFESQYPERALGKETYTHEDIDTNPLPRLRRRP